mmetsp:Transcript_502/g.883  ORF Transcript_502/g.883 Transcript_502/m.883 type:complete len:395 (-) Transcript_502:778-1962(-)
MSGLTCNTAPGQSFTTMEELKAHYKTDWHRYNLKRKAASLPVVSNELFDQMASRSNVIQKEKEEREKQEEEKRNRRDIQSLAAQRGETFKQAHARMARSLSKKHDYAGGAKQMSESDGDDDDEDDDDDDSEGEWEEMSGEEAEDVVAMQEERLKEIEEFEWNGCTSLFDTHVADSVPEALTYMGNKFAFFIPDNDFVSDLDGILTYLAMKINLGHQCTYCHKTFKSGDSTRKHMVDKGHCKLAFGVGHEDEEEELEDYYDYADANGDCQMLATGGELGGPMAYTTGGLELAVGINEKGEGGHIIGSRSLARYYKQKPRPSELRDEVTANQRETRVRMLNQSQFGLGSWAERVTAKQVQTNHKIEYKAKIKQRACETNTYMQGNLNRNLPKNVPY